MESFIKENVQVIFGYPGGANMPIYDAIYDYDKKIRHILVRHEQGAAHAAEGYARVTGKPGVCLATSGPGATNLVTGIADAMMDSVPMVAITGQVATEFLGSDAFQETDIVGITTPVTKWNCQVTHASEIAASIAKAFFIASQGRPGPVLVDITKSAQLEEAGFEYPENFTMAKYANTNYFTKVQLMQAAEILNHAQKPLILVGHGVLISGAEKQIIQVMEKTGIPAASTIHGLSAVPSSHPLYVGLLGMHGNYSPNKMTNRTDAILAVGMRFDDRVTGKLSAYLPNAKVIHVDIDRSEHHKNVRAHLALEGDAKEVLTQIMPLLTKNQHAEWVDEFKNFDIAEVQSRREIVANYGNSITMDTVLSRLSEVTKGEAVIVADVGQNQMFSARFSRFNKPNSFVTSGGLGTMGFALPAAIGAKVGVPERLVIAVVGDGGFQMTIQELGTIMQEKLPVKILILNNGFLGMVRQWQEIFFSKRYSYTPMQNPDFVEIAHAYGIRGKLVDSRDNLDAAIAEFITSPGPNLLEVKVENEDNIFPMVYTGTSVDDVRLK
jgi:acetolactate synthase I/II/III large subunit